MKGRQAEAYFALPDSVKLLSLELTVHLSTENQFILHAVCFG